MSGVLDYLNSKSIPLKAAGPDEYKTFCFFHGEEQNKPGRLYFHLDPGGDDGVYYCFVCGEKGNLAGLKRHFGDATTVVEDESLARYEIVHEAAAHYARTLSDFEEVVQYLLGPKRGLTVNTIVDLQLGYAAEEAPLYPHLRDLGYDHDSIVNTGLVVERENGRGVYETFRDVITIPYLTAGNIRTLRGRAWPWEKGDKRPKYKSLPGDAGRLFNSDVTWDNTEVAITEGEFDAMVLGQIGVPAVAVPGAGVWGDTWDAYFTDTKRIYLVFDEDKAGKAGKAKLQERFGSKAREINLSSDGRKLDPTDWVQQGHDLNDWTALVLEANKTGGFLITVDEALEEFTEYQGADGLKFGCGVLDAAIKPGLLPAQLMIVLAKTNTGKTIWLLNQMQQMAMHPHQSTEKFLFLSLEQTRGEWWDRARRIYRFFNQDDSDNDALEFWRDRLLIADRNRLTSADVMNAVDDFDFRMGQPPSCIFLDYLGYWSRSFRGDEYARISDAVMELKATAKDLRIPIVAPHQVNRMTKEGEVFGSDSARGSGVIEETADFVLGLYSVDNQLARDESEKSGIISGKILKSRHGGRGQSFQYQFAPLTLAMVPVGNPNDGGLVKLAKEEMGYRENRDSWQQAIYRHKTGMKGNLQGTFV